MIKKFNQLFEGQEEELEEESLADKFGVGDFKIKGIIKKDENEVVFIGRSHDILAYLTINFNDKTIKVVEDDEN